MLFDAGLGFINHLLREEAWPCERLRPFAGQHFRLVCGNFDELLRIADDGLLVIAAADAEPRLTLTLPGDAPIRFLLDRKAVEAELHIEGAADLAEALGFILRNLSWDVEADLALLVGDVAARRLAEGGRRLREAAPDWLDRLSANVGSFLAEQPLPVVRRADFERWAGQVGETNDAADRLAARVASLEDGAPRRV